ncbi:bis(5'-nucleosyl)-tetraphosphatase PrpE [Lentibacillus cibarius]|uniref:Bis(5'-nucleosyl)-tetraphosphatase PrpE n=1 Tax=Lentibacillus cibarius TaxID=2583219 RepID=A0A5S3QR83_9BACI|nr:bis(5'-nucleosyl)-tetraphosphatase PrpE [Lentibacillus cibarius]TMN23136.1 bis(5'-nucleosyl)-tetraphosphatase PrpE [Lentibacillus cibarius]
MKYDVIGDVHGCLDELTQLFSALGYRWERGRFVHPDGRIPVFLGDITDRGPQSMETIRLVYAMAADQQYARYIPGNHCNKLYRYFLGNNVQLKHGLETTAAEYKELPDAEQFRIRQQFMTLYENAPLYLELPDVEAVVAHAGIKEDYIGRYDKKVKTFVLYGDITGQFDDHGRPIRRDWAQHYHGDRWIVYGHTPVKAPRMVNQTINIDTGCVFGNQLTAFRLPEAETVSVPSKQPYVEEKFST